ncbi:MAG: serine hydrolase domain-containing protein [Mycobacteriales bacterium]
MTELDADRVAKLVAFADGEVAAGRLPACQLALAVDGEVVVRHTAGVPEHTRFTTFSVTKALTAAVAWLYLAAETTVVDLIPEFAGEGKEHVTVEHLLTHTAGFPRAPLTTEEAADPVARRARFATWRLDWEPGTRMEYHATSAHWVVATMVEVAAGRDFRDVVRERVLDPLGLTSLRLGEDVPALDVVHLGSPSETPDPLAADPAWLLRFNEPFVRRVGNPGAGAVSTAEDVALLYQHLLHDPKGLWDPTVLADGTAHVRTTLPDPWTGVPANRTLGLTVAGGDGQAPLRQFGRATGPRAFGANGLGGQVGWADPDSGLSFCFLTNGLDRDQVAAFLRSDRVSTLAARCVPGADA